MRRATIAAAPGRPGPRASPTGAPGTDASAGVTAAARSSVPPQVPDLFPSPSSKSRRLGSRTSATLTRAAVMAAMAAAGGAMIVLVSDRVTVAGGQVPEPGPVIRQVSAAPDRTSVAITLECPAGGPACSLVVSGRATAGTV